MSEIKSVALAWNQCERGVMGHTPLPFCPPSTCTVMSRVAFGVLELGVTLVPLSDRNLGRPPFQTPVVMTQEGGCVP